MEFHQRKLWKSQANVAIFAPYNFNNDINRTEIIQDRFFSMRQL